MAAIDLYALRPRRDRGLHMVGPRLARPQWAQCALIGIAVTFATYLGVAFLIGPAARRPAGETSPLTESERARMTPTERVETINAARHTLIQSAIGLVVIGGAVFTALGLWYTARTVDTTRESEITEYTERPNKRSERWPRSIPRRSSGDPALTRSPRRAAPSEPPAALLYRPGPSESRLPNETGSCAILLRHGYVSGLRPGPAPVHDLLDIGDLASEPKRGCAECGVSLAAGGLARQFMVGATRHQRHSDRSLPADKCATECARHTDEPSENRDDATVHIGPNAWRGSDTRSPS
ncbi:hypothetical protein [Spongiactinospora gelatinilytica]|uniref:hypothetical protein n=1 Tax=Spongiactinospora gelatinilytica TaxID=2666298 RepID=UPI0011B94019|nr:hypothetical protein [Spongiactinospora gelatinilytica]